jgi:hypothetical protein
VDRELARRRISSGLWLGLGAIFLFGFVFFVSILYIA